MSKKIEEKYSNERPVFNKILNEVSQGHETRRELFIKLEEMLKRPIVSFFTSFNYPVMIDDNDANMLEGVLQKIDLSKGLVLFISSPGGNGLTSERIINICRSYSGTKEFWALVPGEAKSAATLICFGASKIIMGATSELGPVDPQIYIQGKPFSAYGVVKSYEDLFQRAVAEKQNIQPYIQQLERYDEKEIAQYRDYINLSEDISVNALKTGMMKKVSEDDIKEKIKTFVIPDKKMVHARPIYAKEVGNCGLNVETEDVNSELWQVVYELYLRTNSFVNNQASKCIESREHSFFQGPSVKQQ